MFKKSLALVMALAMTLSLCVSAVAVECGTEKTTVYDIGNGISAVVTVSPAENGIQPRTGSIFTDVANPTKTHNYNLIAADGDCAYVWVTNEENEDSDIQLKVTYSITVNGEVISIEPEIVDPGDIAKIRLESNTGSGISGRIVTTIQAYRASSATYTYELDQYWS